jgi:hypothetical protein
LALLAFSSLIDATPVPENRAKTPKEVQKINKWLGEDKNSDILKDILEVAANIIKIHNLEDNVEGNNILNLSRRWYVQLFVLHKLKNHSLFWEIIKKFYHTSP